MNESPAASPRQREAIIAAHGLTKSYKGVPALRGIDLDIHSGEIFGILGPNGAGKTTTLEMIEGLREPDSGTIMVAGLDALSQNRQVRKIIGVQLQTTALFPFLTAGELIELFGSFYDVSRPGDQVDRLLELVGLEEKRGARVNEMSGGQQQRLSIALALVNTPKVTFLDEPTTGLDPRARRNMWQTILDVRDAGTSVVLTTHYMEEAEYLCDRIAVMDAGRIIACDTPAGLIRMLNLDAVVTGTLESSAIGETLPVTQHDFDILAGVQRATLELGEQHRVSLHSRNVQDTIIGLLELARTHGFRVDDLTSTRASLEDVFLQLTGREYATEEAAVNSHDDAKERS